MGSSVAPLAVLLVLGLTTGVWSLNPDDPNVCSHWERWASSSRVYHSTLNFSFKRRVLCIVDPAAFFSVYLLLHVLLAKVPDLFSGSIQQYRSRTARVAKLWEMGGAAASNEIHRQIDQCTLIPINHGSHRSWIIISCAGQCHLWEISRNNFCPQCKGEERKLWRYIIWIIAWPRWGYLGIVVPPCWHRNEFLKWAAFMALRSSNILRLPLAAYITNMNHLKAPFKSFLCISKLLYYFHLGLLSVDTICTICVLLLPPPPFTHTHTHTHTHLPQAWQCIFPAVSLADESMKTVVLSCSRTTI